ncbi:hypothetical protein [Microcoleus sp. CZ3-B4]|uniref:hypothetical protein n=1 Tax=Microcoleus sp. CZ3-B4 TaxID=2818733 RepID=UPI002FD1F625
MNSQLLSTVLSTIKVEGIKNSFAGGIWGSLIRNEITALSDIDVLCFIPTEDSYFGNFSQIQNISSSHRIDILACVNTDLLDFALVNGLNFHAVFFLREVVGESLAVNSIIHTQRKLHSMNGVRAREILNVLSSYCGLASSVSYGDKRWAKFSFYGTNRWVRLIQAAQLRFPEILGQSTGQVLVYLAERYAVNSKEVIREWKACLEARKLQEANLLNGTNQSIDMPHDNYWTPLASLFIQDIIPWIQCNAGVPVEILKEFSYRLLGSRLNIPSCNSICQSTTNMLTAFVSKDKSILERIAVESINDWWVCSTLAANPHTPSQVLERILFSNSKINKLTWQTIRLYVAKNPNTSTETLECILNTPNLREQDYEAAMFNLECKKDIKMR